jgi:hypothetical protein
MFEEQEVNNEIGRHLEQYINRRNDKHKEIMLLPEPATFRAEKECCEEIMKGHSRY